MTSNEDNTETVAKDDRSMARSLARLLGVFHNISYYAPEMKAFADVGLPEYWRAYMTYRSAPMGRVEPSVVAATFYNFAPPVVASALPSAWDSVTPQQAISLRDDCIDRALRRALGDMIHADEVVEAAELALAGIDGTSNGARPLFASHADLPVPDEPHLRLWHASTLWREHRGDGHNLALAAADIDGLECHVLLAAKGVGGQEIIEKIRGWSLPQWQAAQKSLAERGILDIAGGYTDAGKTVHDGIESQTDDLAREPRERLGPIRANRLTELMGPIVGRLIASGAVPGRWPPPIGKAQSV
jgi:hypothetical protein